MSISATHERAPTVLVNRIGRDRGDPGGRFRQTPTQRDRTTHTRSSGGFTLFEVLIATLILFSAVSIGSVALGAAVRHFDRISSHIQTASTLSLVKDLISDEIQSGRRQGAGDCPGGFAYEWKTKAVLSGTSGVDIEDVKNLRASGSFRLTLHEVTVTVQERNSRHSKPHSYTYRELAYSLLTDNEKQ
jgi:hypothetical protein